MQRAQQLLVESEDKIINVALESGYRHLGLFNAMFKKRFGVTPSQWRQQNVKSSNRTSGEAVKRSSAEAPAPPPPRFNVGLLLVFFVAFFFMRHAFAENTNAPAAQPPPATNSVLHFTVKNYLISGNTLLTPKQIQQALTNVPAAFGTNVTIDDIRSLMGELLMAYRERGFVTVSIFPPSGQKLTNATVKLQVTEGRISNINVQGNTFFSTPNVLRALPSLHTNMMLNSHVFQAELDRANANRDRQIYPVVSPGPEPGTTALTLNVTNRLPLHARGEINNIVTPGTPDTRAFFSAQYNNLWNLEHQAGVSYTFTPVNFHAANGDYYWWPLDLPLIGNYSAYYRIPLGPQKSVQQQIDDGNGKFGYNEVTHQFQMPPPSGRPELTVYASRSVVDTSVKFSNYKTIIGATNPLLSIVSFDTGQNITANGNVGGKLSWPLPQWGRLASSLSAGMDFKHFQQSSYNSNNFVATTLFTNSDGSVTPIQSLVSSGQPVLRTEIYYLPMNVGVNASIPDRWGQTYFNAQANFNLATMDGLARTIATENVTVTNSSGARTNRTITVTKDTRGGLSKIAGDPTVHDGFITLQFGLDRQQRLYKDWNVKLHADGQWANGHLFSNEQFGMGGSVGVRGYQDGEVYGDAGWRISVEPQTPLIQFGAVDGNAPVWLRGSVFVDYGQAIMLGDGYFPRYASLDGPVLPHTKADPNVLDFLGAGWSISANIGSHFDGRFTMAFPLTNPGYVHGWSTIEYIHVYFILGAQF